MKSHIVRTTRSMHVNNGDGEPVETVDVGNVERVERESDDMRSYDENTALQQVDYLPVEQGHRLSTEIADLNSWIRVVENMSQRQLGLLREFDLRLSNSEARNSVSANSASFERTGFWALWGILMIILGSALGIVVTLILASIVR